MAVHERTSAEALAAHVPGRLLASSSGRSWKDLLVQIISRQHVEDSVIVPARRRTGGPVDPLWRGSVGGARTGRRMDGERAVRARLRQVAAYGQSKTANALFAAAHLAKRYSQEFSQQGARYIFRSSGGQAGALYRFSSPMSLFTRCSNQRVQREEKNMTTSNMGKTWLVTGASKGLGEDARALVMVVPLASRLRGSRGEVDIGKPRWLPKRSAVNIQGFADIDQHALIRKLGKLSDQQFP